MVANGVNTWQWNLDENKVSTQQNPTANYFVFNKKNVMLTVSNGFCKDSSIQEIELKNFLKSDFAVFEDNCPNEPVLFTSNAVGQIISHSWVFGDGASSSIQSPTHTYSVPQRKTVYNVRYTVGDSYGCTSTITKPISVYTSCFLAVPSAFTPNGDGLNDYLQPLNAIKAEQVQFKIFNRWGQIIYKTSDWKQGWDGTVNGIQQAAGTYVYLLQYINRDTKKPMQEKGTVVLIR